MASSSVGGLSRARLQRLDRLLQKTVDGSTNAGAVALIHRHGEEAHAVAVGFQDLERKIPMQRDSIFRIASMTKPLVSAAALSLVEEGRLRLFEPLDAWLPELSNRKVLREPMSPIEDVVPAARAITLHDVLTFRLGIGWGSHTLRGRFFALMAAPLSTANAVRDAVSLDADAFMKALGELPSAHQPGAGWLYHTPADILGVLVSRVAGRPLEEVLRERIFEPLGMVDTSFSLPQEKRSRLTVLYTPDETNPRTLRIRDGALDSLWCEPPLFQSAGGGLLSTADDFEKFAQLLIRRGEFNGVRVLSRKSIEAMTTDWLTSEQHKTRYFKFDRYDVDDAQMWGHRGFGYGVSVRTERVGLGPEIGAVSWPGAFGTGWIADRAESLSLTFLTQIISKNPFYSQLFDDVLAMTYQAIDD